MTTWRINQTAKTNGRNSLMVESEHGSPIAEVKMQYLPSGRVTATPDKTEQQKNAELIATAPQLLSAARAAAKSHMMYGKVMQRDIDALVDAIHKAQGGAL